jgi:hypothetical protein
MPTDQLDLFGALESAAPVSLKEERRFGKWDAKCGLPLKNYYTDRISGERLAAYIEAFREERAKYARENSERSGDRE